MYPLLRASVRLPIFLTFRQKLRKPHTARKAVIGMNPLNATYLVGSSMLTLQSWFRHLASPLRCIFQL